MSLGQPLLCTILISFCCLLLCLPSLISCQTPDLPIIQPFPVPSWIPLPRLDWLNTTAKSDWVNAMSLGRLQGNCSQTNLVDDTAALQAAIDQVTRIGMLTNPMSTSTLYLPSGNYCISSSLYVNNTVGFNWYGDGGDTRIIWIGPLGANSMMIQSLGAPQSRFIGLTLYGNYLASIGFVQRAWTKFETAIRWQYSTFVGFRSRAISAGGIDETLASSEQTYRDCLFYDNLVGIYVSDPNYYNHLITNSDFYHHQTAVYFSYFGEGSVRRSHFFNSTAADIRNGSPGFRMHITSVSSLGSNTLFLASGPKYTLMGNVVEGHTDPHQMFLFGTAANWLADNTYLNMPHPNAPIWIARDNHITSQNVRIDPTTPQPKPGAVSFVVSRNSVDIPTSMRANRAGKYISSGDVSFRRTVFVEAEGKIFNAFTDFGSASSPRPGAARDTGALVQQCINAAARAGQGAACYVPAPTVALYRPIVIDHTLGANFSLIGSGYNTRFDWVNQSWTRDVEMIRIVSPQNVTIRQINFFFPFYVQTGVGIRVTNAATVSGSPPVSSLLVLDAVLARLGNQTLEPEYSNRHWGLFLDRLTKGDRVHIGIYSGSLRAFQCGRAFILIEFMNGMPVRIEGEEMVRDGYFGINSYNNPGLVVRDNQNLAVAEYYFEQTTPDRAIDTSVYLIGADNPDIPPGKVSMNMAKMQQNVGSRIIEVRNYKGFVAMLNGFMSDNGRPYIIKMSGSAPLTFLISRNHHSQAQYIIDEAEHSNLTWYGIPEYNISAGGYQAYAQALDLLAELTDIDVEVNGQSRRRTVERVQAPEIRPPGGTFLSEVEVLLFWPTATRILYTLDGSDPIASTSALWTAAGSTIRLSASCTLSMVGFYNSTVGPERFSRLTSTVYNYSFVVVNALPSYRLRPRWAPSSSTTNITRSWLTAHFVPAVPGFVTGMRYFAPGGAFAFNQPRYIQLCPDPTYLGCTNAGGSLIGVREFRFSNPNRTWQESRWPPLALAPNREYALMMSIGLNGPPGEPVVISSAFSIRERIAPAAEGSYLSLPMINNNLVHIASGAGAGNPANRWGLEIFFSPSGAASPDLVTASLATGTISRPGPPPSIPKLNSDFTLYCNNTRQPFVLGATPSGWTARAFRTEQSRSSTIVLSSVALWNQTGRPGNSELSGNWTVPIILATDLTRNPALPSIAQFFLWLAHVDQTAGGGLSNYTDLTVWYNASNPCIPPWTPLDTPTAVSASSASESSDDSLPVAIGAAVGGSVFLLIVYFTIRYLRVRAARGGKSVYTPNTNRVSPSNSQARP